MGIGAGIFLLVVGAILAFAISDSEIAGINLEVIGYICMAAGVVGIILGLFAARSLRPKRLQSTETVQDSHGNEEIRTRETRER